METFSASQAICAGNSPVTGEFPSQRPVTRSLMFSLICAWINDREAGDLRRHRAHYDVIVMRETEIYTKVKPTTWNCHSASYDTAPWQLMINGAGFTTEARLILPWTWHFYKPESRNLDHIRFYRRSYRLSEGYHHLLQLRYVSQCVNHSLSITVTSQWAPGVSNHRHLDCLLSLLFRCTSKKTSKHRVTGICEGSPSHRAAENVFLWWRHHVTLLFIPVLVM